MEEVIHARGHENVSAEHASTFEVTTDDFHSCGRLHPRDRGRSRTRGFRSGVRRRLPRRRRDDHRHDRGGWPPGVDRGSWRSGPRTHERSQRRRPHERVRRRPDDPHRRRIRRRGRPSPRRSARGRCGGDRNGHRRLIFLCPRIRAAAVDSANDRRGTKLRDRPLYRRVYAHARLAGVRGRAGRRRREPGRIARARLGSPASTARSR